MFPSSVFVQMDQLPGVSSILEDSYIALQFTTRACKTILAQGTNPGTPATRATRRIDPV